MDHKNLIFYEPWNECFCQSACAIVFSCNLEIEDGNKVDETQTSEGTESEEKRDKTKEELEKESTEAKEDEKKSLANLKELEPVPSKTKGPTVSIDIFSVA